MNSVRRRALFGLVVLLAFTAVASLTGEAFYGAWWFYTALGGILSASLLEPFYTAARPALVNAIGAIAAFFTVDRSPLWGLWVSYLGLSLIVVVAALLAIFLADDTALKRVSYRVSSWGTAVALGVTALQLYAVNRIAAGDSRYVWLVIAATLVAFAPKVVPLAALWRKEPTVNGALIDAIAPGVVLLGGLGRIEAGRRVRVSDVGEGVVTGQLPGQTGWQTVVSLAQAGDVSGGGLQRSVGVEVGAHSNVVGVAGPGTTVSLVHFTSLEALELGQVLAADVDGADRWLQVVHLELNEMNWSNSKAVGASIVATQLGTEVAGWLRHSVRLLPPHAPLRLAAPSTSALPSTHFRVGELPGTSMPIGVATDPAVRGHVAVLGMSGMGKTTTVAHIGEQLSKMAQVVVLDVTGEYSSKRSIASYSTGAAFSNGFSVQDVRGAPAAATEVFVREMMNSGHAEYMAGSPNSRVVLLEEAHSLVPEWNFASRPEQDASALSARYVMQARKFGLSFVLVSQRTAVVSKSVLSQCESYIVFRVVDDTSLSYLESIVGPIARQVVPSLKRYEALCFGPAFNSDGPVVVRMDV
ncbi:MULTISPECIES: ATP-binding protein [unclassified Curtobacterium]|uniref:ATP-binding protein n=1 Tax=unclassified Curtobacterium TaxID=257496 RepID=UPI001587BAAB|nr:MULTISPECIES: DUF87 domain-containing protein [unclassified Curtobacterium]MCT9621430.1 DUF87 domain-containing protein [Curtobacterium sp. C2H10]